MTSVPTGRGEGELRWVEKDDKITNDSYLQHSGRQRFGRAWFGRSDGRGCRGRARSSSSAGLSRAELSGLTGRRNRRERFKRAIRIIVELHLRGADYSGHFGPGKVEEYADVAPASADHGRR